MHARDTHRCFLSLIACDYINLLLAVSVLYTVELVFLLS